MINGVLKKFNFLLILYVSLSLIETRKCNAHLTHIDHNEFCTNGVPSTHLSSTTLTHTLNDLSHLPDMELTPSEYMVDLTNDLAYRILHYHSILNRNNFAISPTALMSVLIAIYEGSSGRSMTELINVLHLPNNHDIIRVGYRDIHRRLRTYFFNSDNPLKGLSLNKENVTITRDYETLLMFYGYDLSIDMVSSTTVLITSTEAAILKTINATTALKTSTEDGITNSIEMENMTTPTSVNSTSYYSNSELSTEAPKMTTEDTDRFITEENATSEARNGTKSASEKAPEEKTVKTVLLNDTLITREKTEIETNDAGAEISSFVAEEPFSRIQLDGASRPPSAKLQAPLTSKIISHYLPAQRNSNKQKTRIKRHLLGLKDFGSNLFVSLLNSESQLHRPLETASALAGVPSYVQLFHKYGGETDSTFIPTSSNLKQNYNTDVISHVFYLHDKQIIYTTFKVYNAVLYYKYFDHLRTSVLELELDTSEYNLIILLPDYNTDLLSAVSSLRAGPKLRLMRKQLKPKWVQAIIPDFKLQGTMFLTNDLQNMGVSDIFEPNRADFRSMTDEKGIYVKHIEQLINVHIRTNPINQLRRNNGAQTEPIQISVNHPFMFFIIDRDLDVAVMAGRIVNPLNVRVQ